MNTPTAQTIGVLLVNLGTPAGSDVASVKRYLREFLSDPYVIDLPNPWRSLLVQGLIIPLRAKKSAHAYQQIWTDQGSPLLTNSLALKESLQNLLGPDYCVRLGMNYGEPNLVSALCELKQCQKIIVLPLFAQYSTAVTESILEKIRKISASEKISSKLAIIQDFYNHPAYIQALAQKIQPSLDESDVEYLLLSYHGLPMRQLYKISNPCKQCTDTPCPMIQLDNKNCYRAQCFQTSRLVTEQLTLGKTKVITCFQSRLGRLTWTGPYTEHILEQLAAQGIKRIAIACPSFITDCLETLEEIGIRARNTWLTAPDREFKLILGLNNEADYLTKILTPSSSF